MINPGKNWLVQLWGKGDEPIAQKYVPESGKFGFQYINAGSYELKLIIDRNRKEKWDTGEYSSKQPT